MINQLTLQQVFDNAVRGICEQGGPAYDAPTMTCNYRMPMPDGSMRKCGIGQSIPDDVYSEDIEGIGIANLITDGNDFGEYRDVEHLFRSDLNVADLDLIQTIHDAAARKDSYKPGHPSYAPFMEEFLAESWAFARRHSLTWPSDVPQPD
jgi:hypothetical protein